MHLIDNDLPVAAEFLLAVSLLVDMDKWKKKIREEDIRWICL